MAPAHNPANPHNPHSHNPSNPSKKEADEIKSKLKLRFNTTTNTHEIYTSYHGSGIWNWYPVLDNVAEWYKKHFSLNVESYVQPSIRTGGFMEITNRPLKPLTR